LIKSTKLFKRTFLFIFYAALLSFAAGSILTIWGLKIFMICGMVAFGFFLIWISWWLNDKGKLDTSKILIFILVYIGAVMAGFSYYLAYIEREEIAESLSKAALVELVAPAVIMLVKSLVENLSINNSWPDKGNCKIEDNETPPI
jgi:apolipoprotein N-acyltransferase